MAMPLTMLACGAVGVACAGYVVCSLVANRRKANRPSRGARQVTTVPFPSDEFIAVARGFHGLYERLYRSVTDGGDHVRVVGDWSERVRRLEGAHRLKAYFESAADPAFAERLLENLGSAGIWRDERKSVRLEETPPLGYFIENEERFDPGREAEVRCPAWFCGKTVVETGLLSIARH